MEPDRQGIQAVIMGLFGAMKRRFHAWRHPSQQMQAHKPPPAASTPVTDWCSPAWLERVRGGTRLLPDRKDTEVAAMTVALPGHASRVMESAARVLSHQFDLLGSGPYRPVDADRPAREAYQPIDWRIDPVSGLRFPADVPYKEWDLWKMRPGNADIKLPWELARCQHFMVLAQAWQISRDVRYAQEIFDQIADFDEANPVGFGVHWTCTMDIAIRAANWALALERIRAFEAPVGAWSAAYRSLLAHGSFIRGNLEDKYEVTSNHFLSNVVGLFYLSRVFHDVPAAEGWESFCREAVEREMGVQVLEDGADFESSVPYHRLVSELFLGCAAVARQSGIPFPDALLIRIGKMAEFLASVLRPDGMMPQLGDADDGRMHVFTVFGDWMPQDGRHLLAAAAHILDMPELGRYSGDDGAWEAFWWGGEVPSAEVRADPLPAVDRLFPHAGIAVHRSPMCYLAVTNGIVGTRGFGNHKHNDLLGFEYHDRGVPVLVDPGSYVYTSDLQARNRFRSGSWHNTLMVDGVEQNEFNPEWIFRMFEKADPEVLEYRADGEGVFYRGRHGGYRRLDQPVVHERAFTLHAGSGRLSIADRLEGTGRHLLRWHFHFAPGIAARSDGDGIELSNPASGIRLRLNHPAGLSVSIQPAEYSPSYGISVPCIAADLTCDADLSALHSWTFSLDRADGQC
jgi:hypothetical protein